MKYLVILLLTIFSISTPTATYGAWSLAEDTPESVLYFSDVDPGAITFQWYPAVWEFSPNGSSYVQDQSAIEDAYAIDPSPLPENVNAPSGDLTWPCEWSQYSDECPLPPSPDYPEPWAPEGGDNFRSIFMIVTYLPAFIAIFIALPSLLLGVAIKFLLKNS